MHLNTSSDLTKTIPYQVDALQQELASLGFRVWYDNKMDRLTKEAMAEGVRDSGFVILFLSSGVLQRPYVQFELEEALNAGKKVLLVHEQDPRRHLRSPLTSCVARCSSTKVTVGSLPKG